MQNDIYNLYLIKTCIPMQNGIDLDELIKQDKKNAQKNKSHNFSKINSKTSYQRRSASSKNFNKNLRSYNKLNREHKKQDYSNRNDNRKQQKNLSKIPHNSKTFKKQRKYHEKQKQKALRKFADDTGSDTQEGNIQSRIKTETNYKQKLKGNSVIVLGFISNVSSKDIFKLVKNRKVTSIKTQLKNKSKTFITKRDCEISVRVQFLQKKQAESFIQEYNKKLLDHKYKLRFFYSDEL